VVDILSYSTLHSITILICVMHIHRQS